MLEGLFLVEGEKNVLEVARSSYHIECILCTASFYKQHNDALKEYNTELVTSKILQDSGTLVTNEDALAVVKMEEVSKLDYSKVVFCLDGVKDPGNLGTIIRTLDWFGYDQVVLSLDTADFYNPKSIAASMGSFIRIKHEYVDLEQLLSTYRNAIYGTDMHGEHLSNVSIAQPSLIIMGSESHGISKPCRPHIKDYLAIPKYGKAESLNVGIATGIIAYHLAN